MGESTINSEYISKLKKDPTDAKAFQCLAMSLKDAHNYKQLIKHCYHYLKKSTNYEVLNLLITSLIEEKQFEWAKQFAQKALDLKPKDPEAKANITKVIKTLTSKSSKTSSAYFYLNQLLNQDKAAVSLCMIVKNEQDNIQECLASALPVVKEIIVVDTGSEDNTITMAEEMGARVFRFKWKDDFAEARNESLKYATGDYIIFLDADERLDKSSYEFFNKLKKDRQPTAYYAKIINLTDKNNINSAAVHYSTRLWTNLPGFKFKNRIHENLIFDSHKSKPRRGVSNISIVHRGYLEDSMASRKKFERNLRLLQTAIKEEPHNSFHSYNLGVQYKAMGLPQKAVEYFIEMEKKQESGRPSYLSFGFSALSSCYWSLQRYNEAAAAARKALNINPDLKDAYYNLALAQIALNQFKEAIDNFNQVLNQKEKPLLGGTTDSGVRSWKSYNGLGICYVRLGDYDQAIKNFEKAFSIQKNSANVLINLIAAYHNSGRTEKINKIIGEVSNIDYPLNQIKGVVEQIQALGLPRQAVNLLKNIASNNREKNPGLDQVLGYLYYQQKDYNQASYYYSLYFKHNPFNSDHMQRWGYCCMKTGDYQQAELHYQQVLQQGANHWSIYHNLGTIKMELKKLDEAVYLLGKARQLNPYNVESCLNLAKINIYRKQYQKAANLLEYGLSLKQKSYQAQLNLNLAIAYYGINRIDDALQQVLCYLESEPEDAPAYNLAGLCFYARKDMLQAVRYFSQATEIDNSVPQYYIHLGNSLKKLDRLQDAKLSYQCALLLDQNNIAAQAGYKSVALREAMKCLS